MRPPALSIVARSKTGKTTLLEKIIRELKSRGYRVGAIKHDVHKFDIDHPGKDSYRLTEAGADTTIIFSRQKLAMVKTCETPPELEKVMERYFPDVDIILTEGFKKIGLPKIEVHREERGDKLLCRGEENDPTLIALASDSDPKVDVPLFDLNDFKSIADFIEERFLGHHHSPMR